MKIFLLLSLMCLFSLGEINSQNKQDYYWPHGKDQNLHIDSILAIELDFGRKPFRARPRTSGLNMGANNASICDENGDLLFYTNGCAIANKEHRIMPEGDSINAGAYFFDFWGGDCNRGYPGSQEITILTDPINSAGYYIVHKLRSYNPELEPDAQTSMDSIQYTYVNLSLDNGLGDVTKKNITLYRDSLLSSYLTSIHHSNGKDWWIINPVFPSGFLLFSLTEQGLRFERKVRGPIYDLKYSSAAGHARFSPDGKKYAYFNETDGLYLYDFDRTDASFSNLQTLAFPHPENPWFSTCEWSPSSRFLYLGKTDTLWQLDTWSEPLDEGLVFIAEKLHIPDGGPLQPGFEEAALGPDCRIYIRGVSSSRTFHIIQKPDEPGLACDLEQQGLELPTWSAAGSFPNFPRFRVDEEEKCDPSIVSIVGETVWWRRDLTVYPSPTTGPVTVEIPESKRGQLYVVDMQGQVVLSKEVEVLTGELELSLGWLPAGVYSVEFVTENNEDRVVWTRKVTKV